MDDNLHDDRPRYLDGVDPQATADDIRAILAASGEGEGIIAQQRALVRWGERNGRKVGRGLDLSEAQLGGLEHYVWKDSDKNVVRKFTYGGTFGRTVRNLEHGLGPASPLEYLLRWANHNALFPPITRICGVMESIGDGPALLIEQTALLGDLPSEGDIEEFMRSAGYTPLVQHRFAWSSRRIGFALFDARPANFVSICGTPIPFDLIVVPLQSLVGL